MEWNFNIKEAPFDKWLLISYINTSFGRPPFIRSVVVQRRREGGVFNYDHNGHRNEYPDFTECAWIVVEHPVEFIKIVAGVTQ